MYLTASEISEMWNVSKQIVRRYCQENRIPGAYQKNGLWYIPENATKPKRKKSEISTLPLFLQTLIKQRDSKHHNGIYEYLQFNMTYSNCRMASNRLTRDQVEALFKTDRILTNGEAIKINDIIEVRNHFLCIDMILTSAMKPLSHPIISNLQRTLLSDTCCHKRHSRVNLGYRKGASAKAYGKTTRPSEIPEAINTLFKEYEAQKNIGLYEILDMHVRFERIRPFVDCNGRIGRLLMLKECLRHNITPFIIDDKRRASYLDGIRQWDENHSILMGICQETQARFESQIYLYRLLEHRARMMRRFNKIRSNN